MEDTFDYVKLNESARQSAKETIAKLLKNQYTLRIDETGYLEASTKMSVGYQFGIVSKISYKFLRYGVFVDKGVGRGHPIETAKRNAAMAEGKGRVAKPWYSEAIEEQSQKLADILQEDLANIAANSIKIR